MIGLYRIFSPVTMFLMLLLVASVAHAEQYQVTFGWNDPTTYQTTDTPTYSAQWRLDSGVATVISGLPTPAGSFSLTASPGQSLEICPQNANGALTTPDCSQAANWIAVGNTPTPPTTPLSPNGFSATIIYTGQ